MNLQEKFEKSLRENRLIRSGQKILIACSGGPDSVALFHLLLPLQSAWKLKFVLAHFNHGLRGKASDQDEKFIRGLGKSFRIPVMVEKGKVQAWAKKKKLSIEEA